MALSLWEELTLRMRNRSRFPIPDSRFLLPHAALCLRRHPAPPLCFFCSRRPAGECDRFLVSGGARLHARASRLSCSNALPTTTTTTTTTTTSTRITTRRATTTARTTTTAEEEEEEGAEEEEEELPATVPELR